MYMKAVIEMRKQLYVYESSYRNVNLDIYIYIYMEAVKQI